MIPGGRSHLLRRNKREAVRPAHELQIRTRYGSRRRVHIYNHMEVKNYLRNRQREHDENNQRTGGPAEQNAGN